MTDSTSEAVAQPTRRAIANRPAVLTTSLSSTEERYAGIHVAAPPKHVRQSDNATCSQKGLDAELNLVNQGRSDLWKNSEIEELRRLVSSNTSSKGAVSWVNVFEAWKSKGLCERTKNSLTAKWREMKNKAARDWFLMMRM